MLRYVLTFLAGCATVIAVLVAIFVISDRRTMARATATAAVPTTTVVIHVTEDPSRLQLAKDASAVLDQIGNLSDAEKKKIRDGIASGLVTGIELRSDIGGEARCITIPVHPGGFIVRTSSSGHFGPVQLHFDNTSRPKQGAERTVPDVTPSAVLEPRR